jgi:drug/metabolite transporter (DMT)-like permease
MALPDRRTPVLTTVAMLAFAANSLLCRGALDAARIDAVSFTAVRLVSGAVALALLTGRGTRRGPATDAGSWEAAWALFVYAAAFSLAYTRIPAGLGALLLFAAVQVTMICHALAHGARLRRGEWLGLALALVGLIVLARPGLAAPDAVGASLMVAAGVAWGIYTVHGRAERDPLRATAGNFARATVPALGASAIAAPLTAFHWSPAGLLLAAVSGTIASGVGYAVWYTALPGLRHVTAAMVQLSVPVLAALGGVILLREPFGVRLAVAMPLVLGGIALAVATRARR